MRHIWTVLCSNSSIDQDSHNISLIEVLEQLQLTSTHEPGWPVTIPLNAHLVTFLTRDVLDRPERGKVRTRLLGPDGNELRSTSEVEVDLESHRRFRVRSVLGTLLFASRGVHELEVSWRASEQDDWNIVARIPIEFNVEIREESPVAETKQ